jgi:hypothetical protein
MDTNIPHNSREVLWKINNLLERHNEAWNITSQRITSVRNKDVARTFCHNLWNQGIIGRTDEDAGQNRHDMYHKPPLYRIFQQQAPGPEEPE